MVSAVRKCLRVSPWLFFVASFFVVQATAAVVMGRKIFSPVISHWHTLTGETTYDVLIVLAVALVGNAAFLLLVAIAAIGSVLREERVLRFPVLIAFVPTLLLYVLTDILGPVSVSYATLTTSGTSTSHTGGNLQACLLFLVWFMYYQFPLATRPRPFAKAETSEPE